MRILSGALPATDTFLHVGYISAWPPPPLVPERIFGFRDLILNNTPIDVAAALRLKDELPAPESDAIQVPSAGFVRAPNAISQTIAIFLSAFVVGVLALYAAKRCRSPRDRFALIFAATVCAVAGMVNLLVSEKLYDFALPPPDTKPPWEGIDTRAYVDPASATQVLMHGIVGDALANAGESVLSLAQLKNEVGLPTAQLTDGERYALQTYGLDGWGQPFRLERSRPETLDSRPVSFKPDQPVVGFSFRGMNSKSPRYDLTSAGPDGTFDTPDDMRTTIKRYFDADWDQSVRSVYLHKDGNQYVALFRRWNGVSFSYANRERARRLTGGNLYDLHSILAIDKWFENPRQPAGSPMKTLEAVHRIYARLGYDKEHPPLVLLTPLQGVVRHD